MDFDFEQLINECTFVAARSSGSGGQNVNKVSTKVILLFNVSASQVLVDEQKQSVIEKLKTRISKADILQISSDKERTQFLNKKAVVEKFRKLLEKAFQTEKDRIATQPTAASQNKKKEEKIHQSRKKHLRSDNWKDAIS